MKKILLLLLSLVMIFSLVACGNNETPSGNEDNPGTSQSDNQGGGESQGGEDNPVNVEDIDFAALMAGNGPTDVVWGKQDEATKQAIIAEGKEDGVDVSFGADGSMTVVDTDGTTITQKPDGTWTIKDADGNEGQVSGDWPDNEFTRLVPKPDFEVYAATGDDTFFTVSFTNATIEGIRAYAEKLKSAGFTVDAEVMDTEMMGITMYNYMASNGKGVSVTLSFGSDASALTFTTE